MEQGKEKKWNGKTRGGTFGYLFFIYLIRWIGIKAAYAFLGLVVVYFIPFAPKATAATWRYARRILGYGYGRSAGFLLRTYYRLGQVLIDKVAIGSGMADRYQFDFGVEYDAFRQVLNGNQGVILLGAHVGNWEIGAPFFEDYGKKIHIVMFDAEYQQIKEVLQKSQAGRDYKIIPVNNDSLSHVFTIKDALDKHEYVCFQGDRYTSDTRVLRMPFLGKEAAFPAGPYILASRMRVPVVFYFATREKGMRYTFHFVLARAGEGRKGERPERELLRQYVSALEGVVREHPEQWFNFYDFWK